jgi:hypothetical protein
MQRIHALAVICTYSGTITLGDRINWPIAIRSALTSATGDLDAEQSVLEAIGILANLPLGKMLTLDEAEHDIQVEDLAKELFESAVQGGFAGVEGATGEWEDLSAGEKGNYTILATRALKVFRGEWKDA